MSCSFWDKIVMNIFAVSAATSSAFISLSSTYSSSFTLATPTFDSIISPSNNHETQIQLRSAPLAKLSCAA
jgi:hypothetical protein